MTRGQVYHPSNRNSQLLRYLGSMGAVLLEDSRRRKLSKLVAHHILRHEDGVKDFAVMNEERMSHELRRDRRAARPGLDRLLDGAVIHLVDLLEEMLIDERTFF